MNEFVETLLELTWHEPKPSYDVVIIGGGGHGLATAYYLATRHGITNVAVIEADYIGSGNSGRNTTIIRANYGIPESIRFYNHSVELYRDLEDETGCWIMHANKGLIWMAHTETGMRAERSRVQLNNACGVETLLVDPMEIKRLCPQIDLTGGGRYPVLGASYHVPGSTARHDRVVWAYAQGAMQRGVHVLQGTQVTGLLRDGDRVVGVKTSRGDIAAGTVMSAVGGDVSTIAAHAELAPAGPHSSVAGVRHQRLRAGPRPDRVVDRSAVLRLANGAWADADRSRVRARVELLAPVVVPVPAVVLVEDGVPPAVRPQPQDPPPVDGAMRHLRRLLADHGLHRRRRLRHHHRLGNLGFQGHSGRRRADGGADRHRAHARPHRAVRSLPVCRRPPDGRPGLDGNTLMLTIVCPHCGPRPVEEFRFGGEIPSPPADLTDDLDRDLDRVWMFTNVDGVQIERWFHEAGCHRWHTARRDTTLDRFVEPLADQ